MRVENLDELKCRLRQLFDDPEIAFADFRQHGTMFSVPGKTRQVQACLLAGLTDGAWEGEAGHLFFRSDAQNLHIYLAPARGAVLINASVISLHKDYLASVAQDFSNIED
ncbi:hypothetical protein [Pseudoxanthomonas sp. CF125]|jgi:hypothetical protein|uniref:hypothetical protein n=1 Tax=Pseudoxanthomonas sp. CF125 TaxID=1855303 RepID=UPI00088EB4F4|nr:hypothetical protein [Pseudoxanthomonas sp. CF125]SDR15930.1 hypothetical protein SAMN05216569_3411 [Pseudoxanthomonas sp. CF125]